LGFRQPKNWACGLKSKAPVDFGTANAAIASFCCNALVWQFMIHFVEISRTLFRWKIVSNWGGKKCGQRTKVWNSESWQQVCTKPCTMNKPKKEHGALLALHGCGSFAQRMADIAVTWAKDVNETTAFTNFDRITSNSLTVTPIWQKNIENSLGSATHEEASKSAHLRNHFAKKNSDLKIYLPSSRTQTTWLQKELICAGGAAAKRKIKRTNAVYGDICVWRKLC